MINTILFDLDGTLLPMEFKTFEGSYFKHMAMDVAGIITPEELIRDIWASTKKMVANTECRTNEEVFMTDFSVRVGDKFHVLNEKMNDFYANGFDKVQEATWQSEDMRKAVECLKKKGYTLVIATNPMFPRLAIEKRIQWAGFEKDDFVYVSSFEENHYCKPQVEYYQEVLKQIQKQPEECLMVGNDDWEDMIAKKLGIKTYLVTDCKLSHKEMVIPADMEGTYHDFYTYVESLPKLL